MNRRLKISRLSLTFAMIAACMGLFAQSLNDFSQTLPLFEEDENAEFARYVNVVINEDDSSKRAFEALIEQNQDEESGEAIQPTKQGYRVGIFFDNGPSARAKAMGVMALCDSLLTDIPASMSYANPYFKVSAGYCISQEEAVITLHRIQRYFPSAYLMREQITPEDILKVRDAEQRLQDKIAEELQSTQEESL